MRCNMTSWSESYSKLERIYKKQIFCCVAFASSKNIKASFFADHKLPWTDLKRLHSQKFKVDITGWVPDEQQIGLWGWERGWVTWRLACRTHRERRCAAEDPDATLPPSLVPPSSPSPPPSSSSSSSPSTVTLILISGLLEKIKSESDFPKTLLSTWEGWSRWDFPCSTSANDRWRRLSALSPGSVAR